MQLCRRDIENPKDSHGKIIKWKSYVQIGKEFIIYEKEVVPSG